MRDWDIFTFGTGAACNFVFVARMRFRVDMRMVSGRRHKKIARKIVAVSRQSRKSSEGFAGVERLLRACSRR